MLRVPEANTRQPILLLDVFSAGQEHIARPRMQSLMQTVSSTVQQALIPWKEPVHALSVNQGRPSPLQEAAHAIHAQQAHMS